MRTDLTRTTSRLAIAAASAGLLFGTSTLTPAQAADLGGDCCADLEERVAELEATAVRHGNRKVKLTLSGQV
ncbi:MAG: porin, partial [Pseudomonadota bacterium]